MCLCVCSHRGSATAPVWAVELRQNKWDNQGLQIWVAGDAELYVA